MNKKQFTFASTRNPRPVLVQAAHALALMRVRRDTAEPALAISRQVLLQPLQQRHEIPDGEDMIFHEPPQILDGRDLRVYGVAQQLLAKGDERSNDPVLACLTLALEREWGDRATS